MNLPVTDPDEKLKPIFFTFDDRDLILSLSTIHSDIENQFKLATLKGKGITVQMNAYDLDELLGCIAAVANHETNRTRQRKLDTLFQRVSKKLETGFPQ
jgi:hypothetical protein